MKKNYNYNELVRFYNRSRKKLSNLLALGKNEYKQDILKRRIARLFQLLTGMQTQLKLSTATLALTAGFVLFQPNAASAQSFAPQVTNPFALTSVPTATAWSTPWFVDLDNDGDKDIMSGSRTGDFYYYQNTGTSSVPAYASPSMNPFGIVGLGPKYSQPSFVDLDNDGDLDMVSGLQSGDIWYFENTGTASAPAFGTSFPSPYSLITVPGGSYGGYSAGSFVDLDNDGDKDFVSGSYYGDFYFYQNTGSVSAPAFAAPTTNPFGLVATPIVNYGAYSTATFVDLDNDGDKDMFSGNGGDFLYFPNTGTAAAPAFGTMQTNPFLLAALTGSNSGASASFADLDNDGDMDLISGSSDGSLNYFENTTPLGITNIAKVGGVSIFPNPTNDNVNLNVKNTSEIASIEVSNVLGQIIYTTTAINQNNSIALPEEKGVYFVKVTDNANKSNVYKVVKN